MAEKKVDECKFTLTKLPGRSISSLGYKLEIPNFFILPEYDGASFDSSPFEYDEATWCFRLKSPEMTEEREFEVYMNRLNSIKESHSIIYNLFLLGTGDDEYTTYVLNFSKKEKELYLGSFNVENYLTCDKLNTLSLVIQLVSTVDVKEAEDTDEEDSDEEDASLAADRELETLSEDFKKLLKDGKNHDLTLKVSDKEFRVHRDVLMIRSPVFGAMLSQDMKEKVKGVIDIPDCDPQAMEQFLLYIYSGRVASLCQDNALGLYHLADKNTIPSLKRECVEFIKKSLSPTIICDVVQLALNHSDSDLLKYGTDYFLDHTSDIFRTVEWMSFLKSNASAANELLIKSSEKWARAKN